MKHAKKLSNPGFKFPALNPERLVFEGTHLSASDAAIWFEDQVKLWTEQFGCSVEITRGVLSRWLHFFALFQGNGAAEIIRLRFGQHLQQA